MCELRFSKQQFKERLHSQLSQDKYSKSDLMENIISLLPSKSKDQLIEVILKLSSNDELEDLMEKVKPEYTKQDNYKIL